MHGRMRSVAASARWYVAPVLLGACSFMAPDEHEYSGGTRDAGTDGAAVGAGGVGSGEPIAIKQGKSAGGRSAGGASSAGAHSVGGGAGTYPMGSSGHLADAGLSVRSPDATPVTPAQPDAGGASVPAGGGAPSCSLDCGASFATGTCGAAGCQRACVAGHADCNHDLTVGRTGNGCETNVAADVLNCGACGAACALASQDAVFCSSSLCKRYAVSVTAGAAGPVHGGDGGLPFTMPCAANEVVVGLHGLIGSDSVYGLGANCARLEIHPDGTSYMLAVVPTSALPVVGGYPSGETEQTSFTLPCPASSLVTAVSGATWPPWGDDRICVKELTLTCTALSIDSTRRITFGASSQISAGKQDASSTAFAADKCVGIGVIRGFLGSNGTLVDNIAVQCGSISLATQTQKKTSAGWLSDFVDKLDTAD